MYRVGRRGTSFAEYAPPGKGLEEETEAEAEAEVPLQRPVSAMRRQDDDDDDEPRLPMRQRRVRARESSQYDAQGGDEKSRVVQSSTRLVYPTTNVGRTVEPVGRMSGLSSLKMMGKAKGMMGKAKGMMGKRLVKKLGEGKGGGEGKEALEKLQGLFGGGGTAPAADGGGWGYVVSRVLLRLTGIATKVVSFLWAFLGVGLGLLALSFLFEFLYPFSAEPEVLAMHAVDMLTVVQQWADFLLSAMRMFLRILRPLIPLWNSASQYVVQPIIFITIEIVSMLIPPFFDHDVFFVMPEPTPGNPYRGFSCTASDAIGAGIISQSDPEAGYTSMAWCGIEGWYKSGVTAMGNVRRLRDEMTDANGGRPPSGWADAQRLQAAAGGRFVIPLDLLDRVTRRLDVTQDAMPSQPGSSTDWIAMEGRELDLLVGILSTTSYQIAYIVSTISGMFIFLLGAVADLVFHVLYVLLDDVIYGLAWLMIEGIKVMMQLFMSLVTSGALTQILGFALDIIVIGLMDIFLPLMFVMIDSLMCAVHLFSPSSWGDELRCINNRCFQPETGGASDMLLFTSFYIVTDEIFKIVEDTFDAFSRLFDIADLDFSFFHSVESTWARDTNDTSNCASCFVCKVCAISALLLAHPRTHTLISIACFGGAGSGAAPAHLCDHDAHQLRGGAARQRVLVQRPEPLRSERVLLRGGVRPDRPGLDAHQQVHRRSLRRQLPHRARLLLCQEIRRMGRRLDRLWASRIRAREQLARPRRQDGV